MPNNEDIMNKILLQITIISVFLFSCQNDINKNNRKDVKISFPTTMKDAVYNYVENQWKLEDTENTIIFARTIFYKKHRAEILKNFEIVDTLVFKDIGLAIIRFSIKSDIYRKIIWLRKVDKFWAITASQYFSKYSDEYENASKEEQKRLDKILDKADKWEKESKYAWFWP